MAKKKATFGSISVLQLVVGLALFLVGLVAIINFNSTGRELQRNLTQVFGGKSDALDLVFGILLLVSGVLVAGAIVLPLDNKLLFLATLIAFVVWTVRIVFVYFTNDVFEPDFLIWATPLSIDLVVLMALWMVNRKYA
jgi:hypothetical protein